MAKYNTAKLKECEEWICIHGLMDHGGALLKEYCAEMGIDEKTHNNWMRKPEYAEIVKCAKETFKSNLTRDLAVSLAEAAKGYDYEETEDIYKTDKSGGKILVRTKTKKVHVHANVGAAIFLLTNLAPEQYQNRQNSNVVVKKDDEHPMSIDEINAEIERLEKLLVE
ncbi:MAG: hypothetical protein IKM23_06960 [Bacteroidales bacterium]|nr:hypothetical protein [Bacteroidales bacterium]